MAQLHYENLGIHRPDIVMRAAASGLGGFIRYLTRTRDHMSSDESILRLGWKPGSPPDREPSNGRHKGNNRRRGRTGGVDGRDGAVWVNLAEPPDLPDVPDSTFDAFFDDGEKHVYEWAPGMDGEGRKQGSRYSFEESSRIEVLDRDRDTNRLELERAPRFAHLILRPNTYTIECQIRALRSLQNCPHPKHMPLVRLLEGLDHARWPGFEPEHVEDDGWQVLTDPSRPGTMEQREFVERALATPDFMILDGPPGSGKTTAIYELILRLVCMGKRVILCASTHVAVDNVLERIVADEDGIGGPVIPVRIGDRHNIANAVRKYQLETFARTERDRIMGFLTRIEQRSEGQQILLDALRSRDGQSLVTRLVLESANLVCGTTIGILQHPEIKEMGRKRSHAPIFDVLILDEASKTTFPEFLVPALIAERWVLSGDPRQLSPYVDDAAFAVNVRACMPDAIARQACLDVFLAGQRDHRKRRTTLVVSGAEDVRRKYTGQAAARGASVAELAGGTDEAWAADIVLGSGEGLATCIDSLPVDVSTLRGDLPSECSIVARRAAAWTSLAGLEAREDPSWEKEVGWRVVRCYEQRLAGGGSQGKLLGDLASLMPAELPGVDPRRVAAEVDQVRRIALPSVLESLQYGFERGEGQRGTALTDGLPGDDLAERHVLLEYQHRMHPDISAFPREHIYGGEALKDPGDMGRRRSWRYPRFGVRGVWIDVRAGFDGRYRRNPDEARMAAREIARFEEWARVNRRGDGKGWEAAVLAMYRGQEREVRERLRAATGQHGAYRSFRFGPSDDPWLVVEVCTVDRFQGHESDLVILTLASDHPTVFLESANRLNVALTRARYQRVVIGNRGAMLRGRDSIIRSFAEAEPWELPDGGEG